MDPQAGLGALQRQSAINRDNQISFWFFVILILLHIALALVEKGRSILVMLHGLATLGAALIYGTDPRRPGRTLQAVAYICATEVFWKMCVRVGALPWEFGKMTMITVLLVALTRGNQFRSSWLPILYIALLLPSALLTFTQMGIDFARQAISTYLFGPLALAMSLTFMSQVRLTRQELIRRFCSFLVPMTGVAFLCYSATFGAAQVNFGSSSNHDTSGGFAPNQVSAVLGFGILCALFWFLAERGRPQTRVLLFLLALWFAIQSALTFSRTGLYLAGSSAAVGVLPLLRNSRARWIVLGLATAAVLLANFLVVPWLNTFTQGALGARFESTNLSGRAEFWKTEIQLCIEHPIFGVGVGMSDFTRTEGGENGIQAHTEYTRMLADHGLFGLAALVVLATFVYFGLRQPRTPYGTAFCWASATYGLLFMVVSDTRLALFALALGLGSVRLLRERRSRTNLRGFTVSSQLGKTARPALPTHRLPQS